MSQKRPGIFPDFSGNIALGDRGNQVETTHAPVDLVALQFRPQARLVTDKAVGWKRPLSALAVQRGIVRREFAVQDDPVPRVYLAVLA
jgi:hypothetical protein